MRTKWCISVCTLQTYTCACTKGILLMWAERDQMSHAHTQAYNALLGDQAKGGGRGDGFCLWRGQGDTLKTSLPSSPPK